MAKSPSFFGLRRGSTKSLTFSVLNGQQITKDRVSVVSNPKTDAQIMQRMKLAPAQNFYRNLEALVPLGFSSHTFQGKKYGNDNRLRFLQLAMLNNQGPYVPKDTLTFIPFDYQISEGSLPSLTSRVHVVDNNTIASGTPVITNENVVLTADNVKAWADFMGVNVGDQLSFLMFQYQNGYYISDVFRVVVASGNTLPFADYDITIYGPTAGGAEDNAYGTALFHFDAVAAAVVVSREMPSGEFLRSSEWIVISDDIRAEYYTPEAMDRAIASYKNAASENTGASPYYNNLGDRAYDGVVYLSTFAYRREGETQNSYGSFFWGKRDNGNKTIFTSNGSANSALVTFDDIRNDWGDADNVSVADLRTGGPWADVHQFDDNIYEQWRSGQKAVRGASVPFPSVPSSQFLHLLNNIPFTSERPLMLANVTASDGTFFAAVLGWNEEYAPLYSPLLVNESLITISTIGKKVVSWSSLNQPMPENILSLRVFIGDVTNIPDLSAGVVNFTFLGEATRLLDDGTLMDEPLLGSDTFIAGTSPFPVDLSALKAAVQSAGLDPEDAVYAISQQTNEDATTPSAYLIARTGSNVFIQGIVTGPVDNVVKVLITAAEDSRMSTVSSVGVDDAVGVALDNFTEQDVEVQLCEGLDHSLYDEGLTAHFILPVYYIPEQELQAVLLNSVYMNVFF